MYLGIAGAAATIRELDDEQAYEAEISQCVGVTGYHHWFFLKALAAAFHYEFRAFAVDSGGERLGVAPLLFRRRGPVPTVNFLPIGPAARCSAVKRCVRGAWVNCSADSRPCCGGT